MAIVYIEARDEGGHNAQESTDYVVKDKVGRILSIHATQEDALIWARDRAQEPLILRAASAS